MAKKDKPLWAKEAEAASKPGAVKCTFCRYYHCRCVKGVK